MRELTNLVAAELKRIKRQKKCSHVYWPWKKVEGAFGPMEETRCLRCGMAKLRKLN